MSLTVRVLGTGDAFTALYTNASLIVEDGSTRLLVEAPPALARALKALPKEPLSLDEIDHVYVSHLHGDHVGGLEQLLFWRRFVTRRLVTIHAIPEVLGALWETRLKGGMSRLLDQEGRAQELTLEDYAQLAPLAKGKNRIGSLELEWRETHHHIPTAAIKVRSGERTVGFSADTSFDLGLVEWLAQSDLYFHETNYGIHTPLESLAALPERLKKNMKLIHYPDGLDRARAPIPCALEGERISL